MKDDEDYVDELAYSEESELRNLFQHRVEEMALSYLRTGNRIIQDAESLERTVDNIMRSYDVVKRRFESVRRRKESEKEDGMDDSVIEVMSGRMACMYCCNKYDINLVDLLDSVGEYGGYSSEHKDYNRYIRYIEDAEERGIDNPLTMDMWLKLDSSGWMD